MTKKENTPLVPFLLQLLHHHYLFLHSEVSQSIFTCSRFITCQFWLSPWLLIQGTLSHSHSTCLCSQQCPHSWRLLHSWSSLLPWFSCNYMAAPSSCISLSTFLIHLLIPPLLHLLIPPLFLHTSSSPLMLGLLLQLYPLSLYPLPHHYYCLGGVSSYIFISKLNPSFELNIFDCLLGFATIPPEPIRNWTQELSSPNIFCLQGASPWWTESSPSLYRLGKKHPSCKIFYFHLLENFHNTLILLGQDSLSTSWKTVVIKIRIHALSGINGTPLKQHHHSFTAHNLYSIPGHTDGLKYRWFLCGEILQHCIQTLVYMAEWNN